MKPLLKYPGSKRRIAAILANKIIPMLGSDSRYLELFAGSGAVYFQLEHKNAVLSDKNAPLMSFYEAIKRDAEMVSNELAKLCELPHSEETYYSIRNDFNAKDFGIKFAAKLLYLNRCGFNGLFRFNKDGNYNVAFGKHAKLPGFPTKEELCNAGNLLQSAKIYTNDYLELLRHAHKGDVIYLDPPYLGTYDRYSQDGFKLEDHKKLAKSTFHAVQRGAMIVLSNIDCPEIRQLYGEWATIEQLIVPHKISCSSEGRKDVVEVIITAAVPYENPRQLKLFSEIKEEAINNALLQIMEQADGFNPELDQEDIDVDEAN